MVRSLKKIYICMIAFCLFLAFSAIGSSLSVTGGKLEMEVVPGETISYPITIGLSGNETTMQATGGIYEYGMGLDGARIPIEDDTDMKPYSAVGFLKLIPENATLEPQKPATFLIEGKVPENVGSGGRYALAYFTTPPQGSGQIGIALASFIPIRLTISRTELVETGEITGFNVSKTAADVIFKNIGNHHFMARAEFNVTDIGKNIVATSQSPLMYTPLIPTASWLFTMAFDHEATLGPGTYTVNVSVIHENGTVLDTAEKTFTV